MEKWKWNRVKKLKLKVDTDGEFGQSRNVHSFKESVEEQVEEQMAEKVVRVIKGNEALVRGTADKKRSVTVLTAKEENATNKVEGENNLKQEVNKIEQTVQEEGGELMKEVDECYRTGKYSGESNRHRPIRITLKGQHSERLPGRTLETNK